MKECMEDNSLKAFENGKYAEQVGLAIEHGKG